MKRLGVYVPAPLAKQLAIYCATTEQDASHVVTEALVQYLGDLAS